VHRVERLLFYTLLLVFVSSFFSITVYEAFLALAILIAFPILLKKGIKVFKTLFAIPLTGHLTVITLSSLFYLRVKEQWRRLFEQDFFSFSYFVPLALHRKHIIRLVDILFQITPFLGLILSIKVFYTYWFHNDIKGFWGGNFVIGNLLALPFFASIFQFLRLKSFLRFLFLALAVICLVASFVATERSIIFGFFIALAISFIGLRKLYSPKKVFLFFVIPLIGGLLILLQSPKVKWWFHHLQQNPFSERTLNSLSSGRVEIAKGAFQLVEKSYKEGEYLHFLIGWGYGPQKQYNNLPPSFRFINEYESFLLLTEFINGGLLNVIFILWFYGALIFLTYKTLKNRENLYLERLFLISAIWVNMVYHLFTLFWVPINGIFYILLAVVEILNKPEKEKEKT